MFQACHDTDPTIYIEGLCTAPDRRIPRRIIQKKPRRLQPRHPLRSKSPTLYRTLPDVHPLPSTANCAYGQRSELSTPDRRIHGIPGPPAQRIPQDYREIHARAFSLRREGRRVGLCLNGFLKALWPPAEWVCNGGSPTSTRSVCRSAD